MTDLVFGDAGDDWIFAGFGGGDVLNGGEGDDEIWASTDAATTLNGGTGNDVLRGGTGNDTLNGDDGHDPAVVGIVERFIFKGIFENLCDGPCDPG